MRKLYTYFIKKHFIAILCETIIAILIVLISSIEERNYEGKLLGPSPVLFNFISIPLAYLIPILEFSFKMKKNNIDLCYALPLKRQSLFISKYLVGLTELLVPFCISFITYIISNAILNIELVKIYYLYFFLTQIGLTIAVYTLNSFLYTRANTIFDGIAFITLFECLLFFIPMFIRVVSNNLNIIYFYFPNVITFEKITTFYTVMLKGGENPYIIDMVDYIDYSEYYCYLAAIISNISLGILSLLGLIFLTKYEKAENTSEISNSIFGYKSLIPLLTVLFSYVIQNYFSILFIILILSFIMFVIYNRGFRFKKEILIEMLITFGISIVVSTISYNIYFIR